MMQSAQRANDGRERWRVLALMTGAQAGASPIQQALGSLSVALVAAFGLSKAQLGVAFSALLIGCTCCTAAAGALIDRWGERRMLLISTIVMSIALVGTIASATYPWLVAMMTLYGAGYAASTPAGGRAILTWFDRERGLAMGIRQTGVSVGALVGALVLPAVAAGPGGYRGAFVLAALIVAVPSLAAYAFYRESRTERATQATLRDVLAGMLELGRDVRLVAVTLTCMSLSATQFIVGAFLTITAVAVVHTSAATAGFALAVVFVFAILSRLGWGFVSDRYGGGDRLLPLAVIAALGGVASVVLALLAPGAVVPLFGASVLLGISVAGWNGLMAAALSEIGGAERAASALGLGLTGIFASSAVAPWLFGLVADATSLTHAWAWVALVSFSGMVPVLWLRAAVARGRLRCDEAAPSASG
jgi:MFS family permease